MILTSWSKNMGKLNIHQQAVALANKRNSEVLRYVLSALPYNLDHTCECDYCLIHAAYTFHKRASKYLMRSLNRKPKESVTEGFLLTNFVITTPDHSFGTNHHAARLFKAVKKIMEKEVKFTEEHIKASKEYIGKLTIDSLARLVNSKVDIIQKNYDTYYFANQYSKFK